MSKLQWFLVPVLIVAFTGALFSGGKIGATAEDGISARLQYEPHLESRGNYELPPILIEFKHQTGAGAADSLLDLTNGAPIQFTLPMFHTLIDPLAKFADAPGTGNQNVDQVNWAIRGTYTNVLTFDTSNANNITITGTAKDAFDDGISENNFFQGLGGVFDHLRSTSTNRIPTGDWLRNLVTDDFPSTVGPDIHKGSTFFINRQASTFIGYDPANPPAEFPYIVVSGLRVWTGGAIADFQIVAGVPTFNDSSTDGWEAGFPVTGSALATDLETNIQLIASNDNVNGAYRMILRVSDDTGDLHWMGQWDETSAGDDLWFDAKPFVNKFYVGGPRVSVDTPVNYNLFTQLSLSPGFKSTFPNISFFLPSGSIRSTVGAAGYMPVEVSGDQVNLFGSAITADVVANKEWHWLQSNNTQTKILITLPGASDELLWSEDTSSVALVSNLLTWNNVGTTNGLKADRALQLCSSPSTVRNSSTNNGKSAKLEVNLGQGFQRGIQNTFGFWGSTNLGGGGTQANINAPASFWKDGPLSTNDTGTTNELWTIENILSAANNGGTNGRLSEAITISGLTVEEFVNPINPASGSDLNLNDTTEPSHLYGQLGLQVFNGGEDDYFKATADGFVIVSGGPVANVTNDAPTTVGYFKHTHAAGVTGPLQLSDLTIVHDQDDWVNKDEGLKLSFRPNSGLYFVPNAASGAGHSGPLTVNVTVGTSNAIQSDVDYVDRVKTAQSAFDNPDIYGDGNTELARSIIIDMPAGAVYEADLAVVIKSALLVTFDPVVIASNGGWPIRFYSGLHQGTNGFTHQSLVGNLMVCDNKLFGIEAVLNKSNTNTVLANMVRADNVDLVPPNLSCRSMRDRAFSTFDHVVVDTDGGGPVGPSRVQPVSMDALHLVFENSFSNGDLFVHLTSSPDARIGIGTFDASRTTIHFAGSAAESFNKVDLNYGTAGRYIRIRREFIATINEDDDLVISGLSYYPNGEDDIRRIVVGYPTQGGVSRLATVTDARVISHQQVHTWIDRPVLLHPGEFVSLDTLLPFPDIYVSHDARQVILGVNRQDDSGDLRFALPGARDNLNWSSDFSRVVYYLTTIDKAAAIPGHFTYGTDGTFSTNNAAINGDNAWLTRAAAGAASHVAQYVDTDVFPGNQGGVGIGIRTVNDNKILGIDVTNVWPPQTTLRISGLMVKGLNPDNNETSHITNNIPTYATLTLGASTSLLSLPGGVFRANPLMGHLAFNYENNDRFQTFTDEPVYVSGPIFTADNNVALTYDSGTNTVAGMSTMQDNIGNLTIGMHEETDYEVDSGAVEDPRGLARGITSDGVRLTFSYESRLRFLTADTTCQVNSIAVTPVYENLETAFMKSRDAAWLSEYGGFARTAHIRFLYPDGAGGDIDVFGFRQGVEKIPAGFNFTVSGLSITNVTRDVVFGETTSVGYLMGFTPRPGNGDMASWDFGRKWRTPGLMLSASSAGVVDAYLNNGPSDIIVNTGSSGSSTGGSTGGSSSGLTSEDNNLFNACLISRPQGREGRRR